MPPSVHLQNRWTGVEVVPTTTIYMKDPFVRHKRKKGPILDLKEGRTEKVPSQTTEAKEVDEEEETLLT